MKAYLTRTYRFSASHRLFCADLSDQENSNLFGKCANPYGHGHNYRVQVTVGGRLNPVTAMVCDFAALDGAVQSNVTAEYDHTNLNLHADFHDRVPTTENLCIAVYERLASGIDFAELAEVRIEETSNNAFVYSGNRGRQLWEPRASSR